ncbi:MAG: tetratricopeptide repeat protein, partial [Candidatus Thorarchaeota archaeon]|nr:tetratricopeptide repeat protein [Candidatus Thorarchaeota archaeon]
MPESPIIPEFGMYEDRLEKSELVEITNRLSTGFRTGKDRFLDFTDILTEFVGSGEWRNRSEGFLAICAKSSFLRGQYGYNQVLAKGSSSIICKGYTAAGYCRQSLDPRWLSNLQTYVNQAWQSKDYIAFAELSFQLASILIDLGYAERARTVASGSIDKVTQATAKHEKIRTKVQTALLRSRILMAHIDIQAASRDEALIRLDSAEETARLLDHELAMTDIIYYRARTLEDSHEYRRALELAKSALQKYELMGYLQGVADAQNLIGVIHMDLGESQDALDRFEELLVIQQQLNNQVGLARTLINLGEIDRGLGQFNQMETYNQRALEISQEAEYMRGIATSKINIGDALIQSGNFEDAINYYKESIVVSECSGMKDLLALVPFLIADAKFMLQQYEEAKRKYIEVGKFTKKNGYPIAAFNAKVSEIVTVIAMGDSPNDKLLEDICSIL